MDRDLRVGDEFLEKKGYSEEYLKKTQEIIGKSDNEGGKGLRYNTGKVKWSLMDFPSMEPLVRVMMYGAHKYSVFETISQEDEKPTQITGAEITVEKATARIKAGTLRLVSSGANNWRKGLDKVEILESLIRHCAALIEAEVTGNWELKIDKESGEHHIGHVGCNMMFYSYFDIVRGNRWIQ